MGDLCDCWEHATNRLRSRQHALPVPASTPDTASPTPASSPAGYTQQLPKEAARNELGNELKIIDGGCYRNGPNSSPVPVPARKPTTFCGHLPTEGTAMVTTTSTTRGVCSICGGTFPLTRNGKMRATARPTSRAVAWVPTEHRSHP